MVNTKIRLIIFFAAKDGEALPSQKNQDQELTVAQMVESACDAGPRFDPWRRKLQHTPVFLPGKSHERGTLAGYSPWDHKESATTELLSMDC